MRVAADKQVNRRNTFRNLQACPGTQMAQQYLYVRQWLDAVDLFGKAVHAVRVVQGAVRIVACLDRQTDDRGAHAVHRENL